METPSPQPNLYDAVPYSVGSFPQTHPDQLATIATLFGMTPPPPENCRVLELGCAAGGNVIPMALSAPGSKFVGIDFSGRQIAQGLETIKELSLSNVELKHLDILHVPADFGQFDYILAHGVYSWVPPVVQKKVLEICSRNLSPNGVAYISYNTLPGWHARGALREMILYHTRKFTDPAERISQARTLLLFLAMADANRDSAYGSLLREELSLLLRVPDDYLFHEHLEDFNEPLYFHQFIKRADANGLQYLAEAIVPAMMPARLGAETDLLLRKISGDLLDLEQNMDFLTNRLFRQTLLCHSDLTLSRDLDSKRIKRFRLASAAQNSFENPAFFSGLPEDFRLGKKGLFTTQDPLTKAAMAHLARIYPDSIPFEPLHCKAIDMLMQVPRDLRESSTVAVQLDADHLAQRLMTCYTSGFLELSLTAPVFTINVREKPVAGPYVRLCAERGGRITNVKLQISLLDNLRREILKHLDGRHDRTMLVDIVQKWLKANSGQRPLEDVRKYVEEVLEAFARLAMLVG